MPTWSPAGDQLLYGDGVSMWRKAVGSGRPGRVLLPANLAPLGMDWGKTGLVAFEGLSRDCRNSSRCSSTDRSEIWVIDPNLSTLKQVTRVGHAENPKWSPDGSQILFIRRPQSTDPTRELWAMNADGSGTHQLISATNVVAADWSPDGSRIAFVRATGKAHMLQLWIADADGSNARPVGSALMGTEATVDW
jgi:Tol biopolymer transport system component